MWVWGTLDYFLMKIGIIGILDQEFRRRLATQFSPSLSPPTFLLLLLLYLPSLSPSIFHLPFSFLLLLFHYDVNSSSNPSYNHLRLHFLSPTRPPPTISTPYYSTSFHFHPFTFFQHSLHPLSTLLPPHAASFLPTLLSTSSRPHPPPSTSIPSLHLQPSSIYSPFSPLSIYHSQPLPSLHPFFTSITHPSASLLSTFLPPFLPFSPPSALHHLLPPLLLLLLLRATLLLMDEN